MISQNKNFFPVSPQGQSLEFEQRLMREGQPQFFFGTQTGFLWTGQVGGSGQAAGGLPLLPPTKAYYMTSLTITSSQSVLLQTGFGYFSSFGAYPISFLNFNVGPSGTTIPVNVLIKSGMRMPSLTFLDFPEANAASTVAYSSTDNAIIVTKAQQNAAGTQRCTVQVACNNSSGSPISNFVIKDQLPKYFRYVSATGTNFTFSHDPVTNILTATYAGSLAPASNATYIVTGQVMQTVDLTITSTGYIVDSDVDYSAQPLMVCGTSISDGTGITSINESYLFLVKKYFKDEGDVRLRIVNKAIGGTTSTQHEFLRTTENRYDFTEKPRLFIYEHGINDVRQGVSTATTLSNIGKMITQIRRNAPRCHIFVLAPIPNANVTDEASLVTLRAAIASFISGLPTDDLPYVHYISGTGTAWNPVTESATYTTDGTHPNPAGNIKLSEPIINFIIANPTFVY